MGRNPIVRRNGNCPYGAEYLLRPLKNYYPIENKFCITHFGGGRPVCRAMHSGKLCSRRNPIGVTRLYSIKWSVGPLSESPPDLTELSDEGLASFIVFTGRLAAWNDLHPNWQLFHSLILQHCANVTFKFGRFR